MYDRFFSSLYFFPQQYSLIAFSYLSNPSLTKKGISFSVTPTKILLCFCLKFPHKNFNKLLA